MRTSLTNTQKGYVVTAVAVPLILFLWLLADGTRPFLRTEKPVRLDIPRGMRTREIALVLEQTGVIRSRWTFLGWHALQFGRSLKAGEYEFDRKQSTLAVLDKLVRGDVSYEVVTVLEGWTRYDIAQLIADRGFATREEFLGATENVSLIADLDPQAETLEGYLFPDSYHLPRHARPDDITAQMVSRFREVYAGLTMGEAERPANEIVTMASLVEKETGVGRERAIVAGVFHNRLRKGMPLQCDPTVVYAAQRENRVIERLTLADLKFPSPYNTYLNTGLPPGPIANPSRASLRAAVRPEATDFLYFVATVDGGHTFSKTLADHNVAVIQYRQDRATARAEARAGDNVARTSEPVADRP